MAMRTRLGGLGLVLAGITGGWVHYHYFDETRKQQIREIEAKIKYPCCEDVPSVESLKHSTWYCVATVNEPWYQKRVREIAVKMDDVGDNGKLRASWSATAIVHKGTRKQIGFHVEKQQDSEGRPIYTCTLPTGMNDKIFKSDKVIIDAGNHGFNQWVIFHDRKQPERLRVYADTPILSDAAWSTIAQTIENQGYDLDALTRAPQTTTNTDST